MKRIGKIKTSFEVMDKNIEDLEQVFSYLKFVPLHTESLYHVKQIETIGHSPFFREIDSNEAAPEYIIILTKDNDGKITEIKTEEVK